MHSTFRPGAATVDHVRAPATGAATRAARRTGPWRVLALLVSDGFAVFASGWLACAVTGGLPPQSHAVCALMPWLLPFFSVNYAAAGLYPGFGVSAIQLIRMLSRQSSLVFLVIGGTLAAGGGLDSGQFGTLAAWWLLSLAAVPLMRVQAASVAGNAWWWREPVLLLGTAERLTGVVASLARARHLGYRPVAVTLLSQPEGVPPPAELRGLPAIPEDESLAVARALHVRTILLAGVPTPELKATELRQHFRNVILVNALESLLIEPTAVRYLGSAVGIEYRNGLLMRRNRVIKRAIDIVASVLGLVLLFPVALVGALAIMICDPGPWWYTQEREGRGGKRFRMWKLRTMYPNAEARLSVHLARDPAASAEWRQEFKLSRDPRILPVIGGLLRRWSLDEYPQFWNVIRGDMSLVGPRPLPPYHLEAFEPEFRALRAHLRPGMTGMWQVMSRGRGAVRGQEALDRYYIYNWSIWMDAFVLVKTVLAVITRRGAR